MKNKKRYNMKKINTQRGASLLEVILAIALSLMLIPFIYNQVSEMNNSIKDVSIANKIVKTRDNVINFIRLNQALFQDENGTPLSNEELDQIAPLAHTGWVFKTNTQGVEITEVFLGFKMDSDYQTANVAKYIGNDAAIVSSDNVAYSQNWAIGINEDFGFYPGDLVFRIVHDFGGEDKNKFLHRGTVGEDHLNRMERTLYMGNNNRWNSLVNVDEIGEVTSEFYGMRSVINVLGEGQTIFFKSGYGEHNPNKYSLDAEKITFMKPAIITSNKSSDEMCFNSMLVRGDVDGFKKITANRVSSVNSSVDGAKVKMFAKTAGKERELGVESGKEETDDSGYFGVGKEIDKEIDKEITTETDKEKEKEEEENNKNAGIVNVKHDAHISGKNTSNNLRFSTMTVEGSLFSDTTQTDTLVVQKQGKGNGVVVSNETENVLKPRITFTSANWQYPCNGKDCLSQESPTIQTAYVNPIISVKQQANILRPKDKPIDRQFNINVNDALIMPDMDDFETLLK